MPLEEGSEILKPFPNTDITPPIEILVAPRLYAYLKVLDKFLNKLSPGMVNIRSISVLYAVYAFADVSV